MEVIDPVFLALIGIQSRLTTLKMKIRDLKDRTKEQVVVEWREAEPISVELRSILIRLRIR
ncbi:MAG: hypothetical protein A2Z97_10670 [Bdellovibrionales bacterium GWB1_52_6]|nr:MAG: hypothetical protein A2Z97_10670 [Bdellovibrionales bacterium GWB1_52_6]OFZ02578.1 MAG: hypothetical protein A2X97_07940 [Bdellovibrionales bacterium GWA1_52_35]HCM41430.1 hypothetical protein [Bdellovibrionales bacterium]